KRQAEAKRIIASYPDRIPIIVERSPSNSTSTLPELDKKKFLCPGEITVGQFQYVVRKRLKLEPEHALFLYVSSGGGGGGGVAGRKGGGKGVLPPVSAQLSQVYRDHKDEDGFL
ncbi:hypothetical protein HK102_010228, partial [Quaeritorhiza haematococci]